MSLSRARELGVTMRMVLAVSPQVGAIWDHRLLSDVQLLFLACFPCGGLRVMSGAVVEGLAARRGGPGGHGQAPTDSAKPRWGEVSSMTHLAPCKGLRGCCAHEFLC